MAIEFGKSIVLASGFDLGAKAPLDSRLTVATIEERNAHVTGNRAYDGMLVYVEADKITYQYIVDADGNGEWKEFGFNEADFMAHVANDLVTDDDSKVLSAAQGVALKALIDAEAERAGGVEGELQGAIDELDAKVGAVPEGSDTVIGYVNKKAQEVLDAATGGSSESAASVKLQLDNYIAENDPKVAANTTAAANAQAKADEAMAHSEGVAEDLAEAIEALEGADEAQVGRIATLEEQILGISGAMHFRGVKEALPEGDALAEYADGDTIIVGNKEYVFNSGAFVEFGDVSAQAEAITALTGRMDSAEGDIDQLQTDLDAAEEAIAKKVEQSAYDAKIAELAGADETLGQRIGAIEDKFGDGEGNVESQIAAAVAAEKAEREAADALKADKTTVEGIDGRVGTLETDMNQAKADIDELNESVSNKASQNDLETEIAAREELSNRVTTVESKAHTHTNADELAKIADGDVAKWNAIEENAQKYTDAEIDKVEAIIGDIESEKTVVQLLAELRTECEANETAAIAAAQTYTDQKIDAVNATIGTVTENMTVVQMVEAARAAAVASAEEKDAVVLQTANAYTDEKVGAIDLSGITTNANNIADLQADVAELQAVEHKELTQEEISSLFTTV